MNNQTIAVSLRETLFQTKQEDRCGFDVTPSGIVTFYSSNIINIYYDTGKAFEPWIGTLLGTSNEVTAVKWCRGMESDSSTPLLSLISDKSGNIFLLDMASRKTIRSYTLAEGYVTAIIWHQTSINHFYVSTSNNEIKLFEMLPDKNTFDLVWSLQVDIDIDFFILSPHNGRELLIASNSGKFGFIYIGKNTQPTVTPIMSLSNKIVDSKYYPFIDNTVVFITPTTVYLYMASKKVLLPICFKGSIQDPLITAYFPNPYNERSILLVFSNRFEFYNSKNLSSQKPQIVPFLSPFRKYKSAILRTAFKLNKLYVLGYGNTIQLFELIHKKFWCTRISRTICDVPSDYDCFGHSMCYVTESGYLHVSNSPVSSAISKYFSFQKFAFNQAVWLTESSLIVSLSSHDSQKVIYIDVFNFSTKSLLNPSMEKMSYLNNKPIICVSPSRKLIAIIVDLSVITFYSYEKSPENLKIIFVEPGTIGAFASDNEFWTFSMDGRGHKYKIDLGVNELIYPSRISHIGKQTKHLPTQCARVGEYLCVGFDNGDFSIYSWDGQYKETCDCESSISSITPSEDHSYCFISTSSSETFKFTSDDVFEKLPIKSVNVKFLSDSVILLHDKFKPSLTLCPTNFDEIYKFKTPVAACLNDHPLMKTPETRLLDLIPKEKCSVSELSALLRKNMFYFISDILLCVDKKRYSPFSLCANFDKERMTDHLNALLEFYAREERGSKLKIDRVRINLMNNNNEQAFSLLKNTEPDDPNFALNILKMSLVGVDDKLISASLSPSVAAIISAGKLEDAIDILMLSHQYPEAARQLAGNERYGEAIQLLKTVIGQEKIRPIIDIIVQQLIRENRFKSVVSIYVSCGLFDEAAKILDEYKFRFPAALIKCLKNVDGNIIFDPSNFELSDQ